MSETTTRRATELPEETPELDEYVKQSDYWEKYVEV